MIKVNLLHAARRGAEHKPIAFQPAHRVAVAGALILLASAGTIGWRAWRLSRQSLQIDRLIADAQHETARLHSIVVQVQRFEQRKAQLQDRVTLAERLRTAQTGPVPMLDQISRSLPPTLWLTELKQTQTPHEVAIDGRSSTLTGLSDFVASLEASGYFKGSVEIVSSASETPSMQQGAVVRFQIRAVFQPPPAQNVAEASSAVDAPSPEVSGSF